MSFQKRIKKDHYKYNDVDEVRKWGTQEYQEKFEDINPDVIIKLSLDGWEEWNCPNRVHLAYLESLKKPI